MSWHRVIGGTVMTLLLLLAVPAYAISDERWDLLKAAYEGDFEAVKKGIEQQGQPVNLEPEKVVNGHPWRRATLLDGAVVSGDIEMVRYLVERGAVIDTLVGTPPSTPLTASLTGSDPQPDIANYLIDRGANVNMAPAPSRSGGDLSIRRPIFYAVYHGFVDLTQRLLDNGAKWKGIRQPGNRMSLLDSLCMAYSGSVQDAVERHEQGTEAYKKKMDDAARYLEILRMMRERGGEYAQFSQKDATLRIPEGAHGFGQCPGLPEE